MIETYGLTHVAIAVRDPERTLRFYEQVVGAVAVYREENSIQAQTPGSRDVLVFERAPKRAGKAGGVVHFGFRLAAPIDLAPTIATVERAGGKVLSHGEFCPGAPYLFFSDPDGYEVEIWYELPTPVDPSATHSNAEKRRRKRA
jgi:catechol 2,3-dioxygenase-like lactoylglutathione lyase family enzyme